MAFLVSFGASLALIVYLSVVDKGVVGLNEVVEPAADGAPAKVKFDPSAVENPCVSTEDMIKHGASVYKTNCAVCHGDKGMGDGPGAAGIAVRNLVEGQWKQGGTSIALFKTLQTGIPGTSMAAFKHVAKNDRWAVVHWIRSITNNAPKDDAAALEAFGKTAE